MSTDRVFARRIHASVLFDQVTITIDCNGAYEAQVLFDDIADTIKTGGTFIIGPTQAVERSVEPSSDTSASH